MTTAYNYVCASSSTTTETPISTIYHLFWHVKATQIKFHLGAADKDKISVCNFILITQWEIFLKIKCFLKISSWLAVMCSSELYTWQIKKFHYMAAEKSSHLILKHNVLIKPEILKVIATTVWLNLWGETDFISPIPLSIALRCKVETEISKWFWDISLWDYWLY